MVEKVIKWGKVGLWIESDKTMEMGFRLDMSSGVGLKMRLRKEIEVTDRGDWNDDE